VRVVAAPDSFKGSITAAAAAAALAAGWRQVRPGDEVIELPLADGGEGTLAVLAAAVPASRWHSADVCGPGTARVSAAWLEIPGNGAVIELAAAAGLPQLAELRKLLKAYKKQGDRLSRPQEKRWTLHSTNLARAIRLADSDRLWVLHAEEAALFD